jgi:phosphatidylglycerol---prolipoprotein diacylglyceryl transferase
MISPIIFDLGFLQLRWYGLLFIVGIILSYFIVLKIAKEKGIKKEIFEKYLIWAIASIVVGARLFEVLFYNPAYYFTNPLKIFFIWEGGLASHGAIIGLILVTFIFAKKYKLHFYDLADIIVIPCGLAAAFVRLGNFFNGELVGNITSSKIGMKFNNYEGLRHPVQLYQSFTNFIVFGIMYFYRNLKRGIPFWGFLAIYSVGRFITEFFKDIDKYAGLSLAQWISLGIVLIASYFLVKLTTFKGQHRHKVYK